LRTTLTGITANANKAVTKLGHFVTQVVHPVVSGFAEADRVGIVFLDDLH